MSTQQKNGGTAATDTSRRKPVPDMGRGSREQMFKAQKGTVRKAEKA